MRSCFRDIPIRKHRIRLRPGILLRNFRSRSFGLSGYSCTPTRRARSCRSSAAITPSVVDCRGLDDTILHSEGDHCRNATGLSEINFRLRTTAYLTESARQAVVTLLNQSSITPQ